MAENEELAESPDKCEDEEFSFVDKFDLEKSLTCKVCEKFLNVGPIMYSEGLGSICGRCCGQFSTNGIAAVHREYAYESLAKNIMFPCSNKSFGCRELVRFGEATLHEKNCRFHRTSCPLTYTHFFPEKKCNWHGNSKLLSDHLKVHQEDFLNPPQFEWPALGKNKLFLTNVGNQTIIVVVKYDREKRFVCLLMLVGTELESQCFRYQLELSDEDKTNSLLLRRNRLEPFSRFTELLYHPEATMEVAMDKIYEFLQNPLKVFAKFGVVKKQKKEILQLTGVEDGDILMGTLVSFGKEKCVTADEEMLAELECPVCNDYMIPPIYICATGHSVCNACKSKVGNCPTCRSVLSYGRNFTLEKLTLKVHYPCRNRDIGCSFVTTSDKIRQHQATCNVSENYCFLKKLNRCTWKGLFSALHNHFRHNHRDVLINVNQAIQKDFNRHDRIGSYYFLYAMGELFCLTYKNCSKFTVKFNVQHVGKVDGNPLFRYTVQFLLHPQQICPNVSVSNLCQNWTDNLSDFGHSCMTMPGELLKMCIYQNRIYYVKVNIVKI